MKDRAWAVELAQKLAARAADAASSATERILAELKIGKLRARWGLTETEVAPETSAEIRELNWWRLLVLDAVLRHHRHADLTVQVQWRIRHADLSGRGAVPRGIVSEHSRVCAEIEAAAEAWEGRRTGGRRPADDIEDSWMYVMSGLGGREAWLCTAAEALLRRASHEPPRSAAAIATDVGPTSSPSPLEQAKPIALLEDHGPPARGRAPAAQPDPAGAPRGPQPTPDDLPRPPVYMRVPDAERWARCWRWDSTAAAP